MDTNILSPLGEDGELTIKIARLRGEAAAFWRESSRISEEADRQSREADRLYWEGVRCKNEANDLESKIQGGEN